MRKFLPENPPQKKSREAEWQAAGEMERRLIALEEQVAFLLREVYSLSKRGIPARVDPQDL